MQVCYKALLDTYSGYEEKLANDGNLHSIQYAREAVSFQNHLDYLQIVLLILIYHLINDCKLVINILKLVSYVIIITYL